MFFCYHYIYVDSDKRLERVKVLLNDEVKAIKGVGDKLSTHLASLGIYTVEDLLFYFPKNYDIYELKPLAELIHEDRVTIVGTVLNDPMLNFYGKRRSRLTFLVDVEQISVRVVIFNKAFAKQHIHKGDTITLTGKWDANRLQITVSYFKKGQPKQTAEIDPKYSLNEHLTQGKLKNIVRQALKEYSHFITEFLPNQYLMDYKLPNRQQAVNQLHFPNHKNSLKHARRRFIYEEFLLFQLKIQMLRKLNRKQSKSYKQELHIDKLNEFIHSFPFKLTNAQQRVLQEIMKDMKSEYLMNRLLQGDVGSGKTAVAAICLYATITAGKQGALMVPTEILAEQHEDSLKNLFGDRAKIGLLTGGVKGKKRDQLLAALKDGTLDIVIGTHALIQDDVSFSDLGVVIVDEQHRFGVEQRKKLRDKGIEPDVLFMTATPIPRTLAITAFGDMDVSTIDELPSGRKTVETYWVRENTLDRILRFIEKRVRHGEQAYVICPLIEESDQLDISNAVDLFHQLSQFYDPSITVGLMHGRLNPKEKDDVMRQFANKDIQILVSTTVVEVGVNVPNATVMVIYDAERFGLSQLHQLRGRVGRGEKQSYCILIADPKGEVGKERMRIMTETNDGFELSEQDLALRGPGDFFGKKQSGLPEFKVADMVHDYRALEVAKRDAQLIIDDNLLEKEDFSSLRKYLEEETNIETVLD